MELSALPSGGARLVLLSDVIEMGMPIAWHEAVAVVRVLGLSLVHQAPPLALPGPSQIQLGTDGRLVALGAEVVGADAVRQLRELLGTLLDEGSAPAELVTLLRDSATDESPLNATEFVNSLTFFARPDDSSELADLAARATAYQASRLRDEALASLTRKARHTSANAEAQTSAEKAPVSSSIRRDWLVAGLLALALGGVLAWRMYPSPGGDSTSIVVPVQDLARRVQDDVSSRVTALQQKFGLAPDLVAVKGRDRELPAVSRRTRRPAAVDERQPLPGAYGNALALPAESAVSPEEQVGATTAVPTTVRDDKIYSAEDASVTAPTLSRPQMPVERIAGISQERAGELELLVGVDGRVEQAKLVPASNRYQDRMMVSAAKTWRFEPATRDGEQVAYRLRMPITW